MSDLRDRIAAVIDKHTYGFPHQSYEVADAVIAALQLREEWGALDEEDNGFLADTRDELRPCPGETIKRRHITAWENNPAVTDGSPEYCIRCGIPHLGECKRQEGT